MFNRKFIFILIIIFCLLFIRKGNIYAACNAGQDYICAGNVLKVCRSDGLNWDIVQDCGEGNCSYLEKRCIPKVNLKPFGSSCNSGAECETDECYGNLCTSECRSTGQCPNGYECKLFIDAQHQGIGFKVCQKYSEYLVCEPNHYKCSNGNNSTVLQKCNNTGSAWNVFSYCEDGTCQTTNNNLSGRCIDRGNQGACTIDGGKGIITSLGCVPTDIKRFTTWVMKYIFGIAGGIAFLLMVYGFILMATSKGDEKKLQGAKETVTSAIIGLLVSIFALFIFRLIAVDILHIPGMG